MLIEFLRFIKYNNDHGRSTSIKDIKERFNYPNHQNVSQHLDKLEDNQLIESQREKTNRPIKRRDIYITPRGVDFINAMENPYLSKNELMYIEKLKRDNNGSDGIIALILSEYTKNMVLNQGDLIKDAILRECPDHDLPESSLENIVKSILQILIELSENFIKNSGNKNTIL